MFANRIIQLTENVHGLDEICLQFVSTRDMGGQADNDGLNLSKGRRPVLRRRTNNDDIVGQFL